MKPLLLGLSFVALLGSTLAMCIVGGLGVAWVFNIQNVLENDSFLISIPMIAVGNGIYSFVFSCLIVYYLSLNWSWIGLSTTTLFLTILGILTLIYSKSFIEDALEGFLDLFILRANFLYGARMNRIQQELQCCGTTGPESFSPGIISVSCCPKYNCSENQQFTTGCNQALSDHITLVTNMIGWTSVGLAIFLGLIGVIIGAVYKVTMKK